MSGGAACSTRDQHPPLLFAAAELRGLVVQTAAHAHAPQQRGGALAALAGRQLALRSGGGEGVRLVWSACGGRPRTASTMGSSTFSSAVMPGSRLNDWNTKPSRWRRSEASTWSRVVDDTRVSWM